MIKAYCISLPHSERRELTQQRWADKGVELEMFDALGVDDIDMKNPPFPIKGLKSKPHVACYSSHLLLLKKIQWLGGGLVIEDDAIPLFEDREEMEDRIKRAIAFPRAEILHCGPITKGTQIETFTSDVITFKNVPWGAHCMYYTQEGIYQALKGLLPLNVPYDWALPWKFKSTILAGITEPLAEQDRSMPSQIDK